MIKGFGAFYNGLPSAVKGTILAIFFTSIATYAVSLIRDGLEGKSKLTEPIITIKIPVLSAANARIPKTEYDQLLKAARDLDGLKVRCPLYYDRLVLANPGFPDSLARIIQAYKNQLTEPIQTNQP